MTMNHSKRKEKTNKQTKKNQSDTRSKKSITYFINVLLCAWIHGVLFFESLHMRKGTLALMKMRLASSKILAIYLSTKNALSNIE